MSKRVKGYPDLSIRDALAWAHQIAVPYEARPLNVRYPYG